MTSSRLAGFDQMRNIPLSKSTASEGCNGCRDWSSSKGDWNTDKYFYPLDTNKHWQCKGSPNKMLTTLRPAYSIYQSLASQSMCEAEILLHLHTWRFIGNTRGYINIHILTYCDCFILLHVIGINIIEKSLFFRIKIFK